MSLLLALTENRIGDFITWRIGIFSEKIAVGAGSRSLPTARNSLTVL